jgi:tetratricopeptide (TPR) repeat protein
MPVYKFSPHLATSQERSETFVGREAILEDLLDRVSKPDADARHCILIGPRGIGKTHLLLLLADRIEEDEALASRWAVIRFAEEEYSITSLAELLLKIIESLPDGNAKDIGRDVDLALAHILDFSAKSGKRILLLMDNIHLYFNQFPDADIGRMRDILISKPVFLIIGAAPSYFRQMTGYEEAFYNFFEPIHLSELTPGEVEGMLRRRAEFEDKQDFLEEFDQCQPKIRAAAHLTGGNPRLILMLYQVMCESGIVEAAEAFKQLLDELTPYFQGRMDGLPPQQRKVLDTLASQESPATPTELAELAGMQVNAVTSQLKRLKDVGYVQQVRRRKSRSTRYEVTERLFRMWREMRTDAGRGRLAFLIRFLTLWYTPVQLVDETGKLLTQLGEAEGRDRSRLLLQMQYLKDAMPEILRSEMKTLYSYAESGRHELAATGITPLKALATYEEEVKEHPDDATAWLGRGLALGMLGRHDEALESFDRALQIQPDDAFAWLGRGMALEGLSRYDEALESFDRVVEIQPDHALAWLGRGMALESLSRYEGALESYDKAIQIQPDDEDTWNNRGAVLSSLGRYEEALESYDKAIQIQPDYALVWHNRGVTLVKLNRYEEALESYDRAVQIQPDYASAWTNRGVTLDDLSRHEEALESYDRAIQIQPDDPYAWYNRGVILVKLSRYEEALESFDRTLQIQPDHANAWYNRGVVLGRDLGRHEEALESYDRAVQIQPDYAKAWCNRGAALYYLGGHEEALESARKAMELAKAQGMDDVSKVAFGLAVAARLSISSRGLEEGNPGLARHALEGALEDGKGAEGELFQSAIFAYLRGVLRSGEIEFAREAIGIMVSELGEDYVRLLRPFSVAIEYMETGDESILERLQQEERELVLEIAKQTDKRHET